MLLLTFLRLSTTVAELRRCRVSSLVPTLVHRKESTRNLFVWSCIVMRLWLARYRRYAPLCRHGLSDFVGHPGSDDLRMPSFVHIDHCSPAAIRMLHPRGVLRDRVSRQASRIMPGLAPTRPVARSKLCHRVKTEHDLIGSERSISDMLQNAEHR
jgi:hypothetical protein